MASGVVEFPVKLVKNNLFMTHSGEVWAYFRIASKHTATAAEHSELKRSIVSLMENLQKYKDIDLFMIPRDMTLEERFEDLMHSVQPHAKDVAEHYFNQTINLLEQEMQTVYVNDWVIGIPISSVQTTSDLMAALKFRMNYLLDALVGLAGFRLEIPDNWHEAFHKLEAEAYRILQSFQVYRLSEAELMYLLRLNFIRHMKHDIKHEEKHTLNSVADGILDFSRRGVVQLESYEGNSVVAFLPLSKTPLELTDMNMAERIQQLPFPVELRYKIHYPEISGLGGLKSKQVQQERRAKNIAEESVEVGVSVSYESMSNKLLLEDLSAQIEKKAVIVDWRCVVVIYGRTIKETLRRVADFIDVMKPLRFVRAIADQPYFFDNHLPGQRLLGSRNWVQTTTVAGFAENLVFSGQRLGTHIGPYVGRVSTGESSTHEQALLSSRNCVFLNLLIGNKGIAEAKTEVPHVSVSGDSGSGKSYLIKLLQFWLSMFCKTLYIDPKKEVRARFERFLNNEQLVEQYPLLAQHLRENFHFVTLDAQNSDNWGVLDPIVFLNGAEAKDLAEDMIKQIYDNNSDEIWAAISEALTVVLNRKQDGERVGLLDVIEWLRLHESKTVSNAGKRIYEQVKGSVLQLAFSHGEVAGLNFNHQNTILEITGLKLPELNSDPSQYSKTEMKSACLMFPLGKYCEKFGSDNPTEETVSFFDEAWLIENSRVGSDLLNSMSRVGRSFNNFMVFGTQSVGDSKECIRMYGTLFVFDEEYNRSGVLDFLSLEKTEENMQQLQSLVQGQCLMKDMYGRLGTLTVHCPFEEVNELFKTVDKTHSSMIETRYI